MTARVFLSQQKKINDNISEMLERLQVYSARRTQLNNIITDLPKSTDIGSSMMEEYTIKCLELEKAIHDEMEKLSGVQKEIETAIEMVENSTFQRVLRYRYLSNKTIPEIARLMCYSEGHVKRLHKEALEMVTVPIKYSA